jgi:hypothetical protein
MHHVIGVKKQGAIRHRRRWTGRGRTENGFLVRVLDDHAASHSLGKVAKHIHEGRVESRLERGLVKVEREIVEDSLDSTSIDWYPETFVGLGGSGIR